MAAVLRRQVFPFDANPGIGPVVGTTVFTSAGVTRSVTFGQPETPTPTDEALSTSSPEDTFAPSSSTSTSAPFESPSPSPFPSSSSSTDFASSTVESTISPTMPTSINFSLTSPFAGTSSISNPSFTGFQGSPTSLTSSGNDTAALIPPTNSVPTGIAQSSGAVTASHHRSNTGAIAGGVVGGVAVLLLVLALLGWLLRRRSRDNASFVDAFTTRHTPTREVFDSSAMIGEKGASTRGSEPDLSMGMMHMDERQLETLGNLRHERTQSLLSQTRSVGATSPDNMSPIVMSEHEKLSNLPSTPPFGSPGSPGSTGAFLPSSNPSQYSNSSANPLFPGGTPFGTNYTGSSVSGRSHGTGSDTLSSVNTNHVRVLQDQVSNLQREVEMLRQERQVEFRPQRVASPAGTFTSAGPPPAYDNLSAVG